MARFAHPDFRLGLSFGLRFPFRFPFRLVRLAPLPFYLAPLPFRFRFRFRFRFFLFASLYSFFGL
jgi:hypothetical protein